MAHELYTDDVLLDLGKKNYARLVSYCHQLEKSGFWNQAQKVMHQSSTEVLDVYVQSVLMNLAWQCGTVLDEQKAYMLSVSENNPLGLTMEDRIEPEIITYSKRTSEMPPVLFQLCGMYDQSMKTQMTPGFLDAFLNILMCMAYLNDGRDLRVNQFIQEYYDKISLFIEQEEECRLEGKRYLVRKLSAGTMEDQTQWLIDALESGRGHFQKSRYPVMRCSEDSQRKSEEQIRQEKEEKQKQEAARKQKEAVQAREEFQKVKKRLQEREKAEKEAQEARLKKLLEELNELVGLQDVKEEIQSMINLIKIRRLRESMQMPTLDMSYHMVFTGSPGTGKTTVARLLARIYKELGVLSEGQLIETDRSGMVAGYVGQTAINVREIVEKAIGGVLFIDEAYALVNRETPNDFGSEAVDTLVKLMEDHRDNLVVIVAGYTQEMKSFLKSNTGLISRFNKFITFPDYNEQELLDILDVMAGKAGLEITQAARDSVRRYLQEMEPPVKADFGNARGIRNLFEKIVMNQANRLVLLEEPTREQLKLICMEDTLRV